MENSYEFIKLGDYHSLLWGYGWFDVETYLITTNNSNNSSHEDVLNDLLKNSLYQRSFLTSRASEKPHGHHGPFSIFKLSPKNFKLIHYELFIDRTNEIFSSEYNFSINYDEFDIARHNETIGLINTLPKDADYYELDVLRENTDYHHELWKLLDVFHEFIIIDDKTSKLYICVFGSD